MVRLTNNLIIICRMSILIRAREGDTEGLQQAFDMGADTDATDDVNNSMILPLVYIDHS